MKTFKSFFQIDELTGVAPKAKGEHKFVHSTYMAQTKDPGDLEKVGPEEVGPADTKTGQGKRKLDRLDNKQAFGESSELEENYRVLAQKGIGAETKGSIKVGHGVDYYHPKDGSKHMGTIHHTDDKGYTVRDDETGEKHKFDYYRKEEVELEGSELDEASYTGKGNHRPGWMLRADPELAKKVKEKIDAAKLRQKYMGKTSDEIAKMKKEEVESEGSELDEGSATSRTPFRNINSQEYRAAAEKIKKKIAQDKAAEPGKKLLDKIEKKAMKEESELGEELKVGDQVSFSHSLKSAPGHSIKKTGKVHNIEGDTVHVKVKDKYGVVTHKKTASELTKEEVQFDEEDISEEAPMAARALYAQTYAKHAKTASQSKEAKQKAYDAVEKKHGAEVLAKLKAHHQSNEEVDLDEADFTKAQTVMAHTIGKEFKKKGVGDSSKGGPFAVASAMVRDKPEAAKKAYATIKAKTQNEDHQKALIDIYDELTESNKEAFEAMLEADFEKLMQYALSRQGE